MVGVAAMGSYADLELEALPKKLECGCGQGLTVDVDKGAEVHALVALNPKLKETTVVIPTSGTRCGSSSVSVSVLFPVCLPLLQGLPFSLPFCFPLAFSVPFVLPFGVPVSIWLPFSFLFSLAVSSTIREK